jgi:hypothetical protein
MGWTRQGDDEEQIAARARSGRRSKKIAMVRRGGSDEGHGKHRRSSVLSIGRAVDHRRGATCFPGTTIAEKRRGSFGGVTRETIAGSPLCDWPRARQSQMCNPLSGLRRTWGEAAR